MVKRVLIAEDVPSHNKGEAALFFGMAETLTRLGKVDLSLVSTNPVEDGRRYKGYARIVNGFQSIPSHIVTGHGSTLSKALGYAGFIVKHVTFLSLAMISKRLALRLFRKDIWRAYLECDLALLGHDSFWAPLYHGTLLFMFKKLKKPAVIIAGTIIPANPASSPIKRKISNLLTRTAVHDSALTTLREEDSRRALKSIGVDPGKARIEVEPDLAFIMPFAPEKRVDEIIEKEGLSGGGPLIGMAFSKRMLKRAAPERGSDDLRLTEGIERFASLADHFVERHKATIIFVPHSIGPDESLDDRLMAAKIKKRMKHSSAVVNVVSEYTPQELKGLAGRLDLCIGSRLHFAIDSLCHCVPSLLFTHATDIRCHGIVGEMLGLGDYVVNIDEVSEQEVLAMAEKLWEERDGIRARLGALMPGIRERTYRHGELIREIAAPGAVKSRSAGREASREPA